MADDRVQRRLAAILAADVVGYSRLMGADETGTLERLKALRREVFGPTVAEFGGRIFKLTGDGAFAEFGSATDAVSSAVAVQRALAERNAGSSDDRGIELRIGISLGDVIVEGSDLYGNGVNVAARMEGLAEPGGICISGNVYEHVGQSRGLAFEDLGDQTVKNIERPVRCYRVQMERSETSEVDVQPPRTGPKFSDRPSIAVLPFDNMSGDPEQEYFSDGMAEDLITDLSKISGLLVVARNSSFAFKGKALDMRDVAGKLGVKHILEGSVRKMGSKLRVNAQLIDAADGSHIWAERYDGDMGEIFQFQDDIREQIVTALRVSLSDTDRLLVERKPTESVRAYDLFLKGRAEYWGYSPARVANARQYLEQSIEIDPDYADAYGYLSYCRTTAHMFAWSGADETLDAAVALAQKAVALDEGSALAHTRLAWVQGCLARFDEARANFETAIKLEPRNAEAYYAYGEMMNHVGRPEEALSLLARACDIETILPPSWPYSDGHAFNLMGRFDDALAKIGPVIERVPFFLPGRIQMARGLGETGQWANAQKQIEVILEQSPNFRVKNAERMFPYPERQEHRRRLAGMLRKAGLPE